MDELVKQIASKTGISEAQAKQAVGMVVDFLKDKLPEPFGSQVDAVMKGDMSGLGDVAGGLGKLFG